jgi:hypothetical protein
LKLYLKQEYIDVYLSINPYLTISNYKCIHNILHPFINDSSITGVFCNPKYTCNSLIYYQHIYYNMSQKINSFRGNAEESRDIFAYRIRNIGGDIKNIYINQKIGTVHSTIPKSSFVINNFNLSNVFSMLFASISIYLLFLFIKIVMYSSNRRTLYIVWFTLFIVLVLLHFGVSIYKFTYYTKPKDFVLFGLFSILKMFLLPIVFIARLICKNNIVVPLETNSISKKSIIDWDKDFITFKSNRLNSGEVYISDYSEPYTTTNYNIVNSDSIIYKSPNVSESSIYNMYFGSSSRDGHNSNGDLSLDKRYSFVQLTDKEKGF